MFREEQLTLCRPKMAVLISELIQADIFRGILSTLNVLSVKSTPGESSSEITLGVANWSGIGHGELFVSTLLRHSSVFYFCIMRWCTYSVMANRGTASF